MSFSLVLLLSAALLPALSARASSRILWTVDTAEVVQVEAPGTVFTDKDALKFRLAPACAVPASYTVENWKGEVVAQGGWPDGGELVLEGLPRGYYTLSLESLAEGAVFSGSRSFAIVSDPEGQVSSPASTFAMDTALSWLTRPDPKNIRFPGDGSELVAELCRLGGINMVRERMGWSSVEMIPGEYDWKNYYHNAEMLSERGVQISGMFHDAPKWTKSYLKKLPDDLIATYHFTETLAQKFKGKMSDWEFWNEEDLSGFSTAGAWDYASAAKAAYLGFKSGDGELPVLTGAFCVYPLNEYHDAVLENDLADYFDVFNYHVYKPVGSYPQIVKDLRSFLGKYGADGVPIWITENGTHAEGRSEVESYIPQVKAHSPEQEMIVAEFVPKSQIYLQSLGVARNFTFLLSPYNEGGGHKDWGLMRRDYTVKPGYVAFATLADQIGAAKYLGELDVGPGLRAFLYEQPDGSQTVAFWSVSDVDSTASAVYDLGNNYERPMALEVSDGSYRLVDIVGTPHALAAVDGVLRVPATRYPAYVQGLSGLVPTTPAPQIPEKDHVVAGNEKDLSVVFKVVLSDDFVLNPDRSSVDIGEKDAGKLTLQIFNLSGVAKTGSVHVEGGLVSGLPESIVMPAFGKVEYPLLVKPGISANAYKGKVVFGGQFGSREVSRLVLPVVCVNRMLTSDGRREVLKGIMEPSNWRVNSSGKMRISYDEKEEAIRFDVDFPEGVDRWVYPEYKLDLPKESREGVIAIAFDIKIHQDKPDSLKYAYLMLVNDIPELNVLGEGEKKSVMLSYAFPNEAWQSRVIFPGGYGLEYTEVLRLGMNPRTDHITYWMRNLRLIYED